MVASHFSMKHHILHTLCAFVAGATASTKRQASDLRKGYDFVIAGGGTSGLTVADRLSEALPSSKLLLLFTDVFSFSPAS